MNGTISKKSPTASAESYGGGLLVYSGAKGTFSGVTFTENEADHGAGVMAWPQAILLTFNSCMFTKNVAKVDSGVISAKDIINDHHVRKDNFGWKQKLKILAVLFMLNN